jgi:hypothetical protein
MAALRRRQGPRHAGDGQWRRLQPRPSHAIAQFVNFLSGIRPVPLGRKARLRWSRREGPECMPKLPFALDCMGSVEVGKAIHPRRVPTSQAGSLHAALNGHPIEP